MIIFFSDKYQMNFYVIPGSRYSDPDLPNIIEIRQIIEKMWHMYASIIWAIIKSGGGVPPASSLAII